MGPKNGWLARKAGEADRATWDSCPSGKTFSGMSAAAGSPRVEKGRGPSGRRVHKGHVAACSSSGSHVKGGQTGPHRILSGLKETKDPSALGKGKSARYKKQIFISQNCSF